MHLLPFSHIHWLILGRTPHLRFNQIRLFSQQRESILAPASFICRLASRSVIRFRGPDTIKFLQGLLTNDLRLLDVSGHGVDRSSHLSPSSGLSLPTLELPFYVTPMIYAALLTPHGRFLFDLFLYRPPSLEQKLYRSGAGLEGLERDESLTLYADVDSSLLDEILICFRKYKLRSKVGIENVSEELFCWQRFGKNLFENELVQKPEAAAVCCGVDNEQCWQWHRDPRLECLGLRGIFPANTLPPLFEADKEADEQHYLSWRIEQGVCEGSTEMPKGEAIPLEYNLEGLNAISFGKGCYVGQELVARTHHRGVIRKRVLPLIFTDDSGKELYQEISSGSEVVCKETNKKVGTVITALGSRGMGLLKLEALTQPSTLAIKKRTHVRVEAFRPEWWPLEWKQLPENNG